MPSPQVLPPNQIVPSHDQSSPSSGRRVEIGHRLVQPVPSHVEHGVCEQPSDVAIEPPDESERVSHVESQVPGRPRQYAGPETFAVTRSVTAVLQPATPLPPVPPVAASGGTFLDDDWPAQARHTTEIAANPRIAPT